MPSFDQISLSELRVEYSELEEAIASVFGVESFAAKKSTTPPGQARRRNCDPAKSLSCGNSCVRLKKKDGTPTQCKGYIKGSPDAKQASQWLDDQVSNGITKGSGTSAGEQQQSTEEKPQASDRKSNKELAKELAPTNFAAQMLAEDIDLGRSLGDVGEKDLQKYVDSFKQDSTFDSAFHDKKVKNAKAISSDLTDAEANALALYVNGSGYDQMNKVLRSSPEIKATEKGHKYLDFEGVGRIPLKNRDAYSEEYHKRYIDPVMGASAASRAAASGLKKLPPTDFSELRGSVKDLQESDPLRRYIKIKDLNSFLETYAPGKEIVERSFTSTTAKQKPPKGEAGVFYQNSNVEMQISYKKGGQTSGRFVDGIQKGGVKESEVLFPPFTRFRVVEVVQPKNKKEKTVVRMEEI